MKKRLPVSPKDVLPTSLAPIGVSRPLAAAYIGIPLASFVHMVADGRMPKPRKIDGLEIWSVRELTIAFEAFPLEGERNEWDDDLATTGAMR